MEIIICHTIRKEQYRTAFESGDICGRVAALEVQDVVIKNKVGQNIRHAIIHRPIGSGRSLASKQLIISCTYSTYIVDHSPHTSGQAMRDPNRHEQEMHCMIDVSATKSSHMTLSACSL